MSRFAPLLNQRVPLYISLPVIVACGVVGFIASTVQPPGGTITDQVISHRSAELSQAPVAASTTEEPARIGEKELARALHQPRSAPSITVPPTADTDLPAPAPTVVWRRDEAPNDIVEPTPPLVAVTTSPARRTKPARTDRPLVKVRRAQQAAQLPARPPSKSSASLKNVPLIGPVFSLFQ